MGFLWIFAAIIVGIIFGVLCGMFIPQILDKIVEKRLRKNALDVINGKRKNQYNDEGKMIEVNRFVVKGNDGKPKIIDLNDKAKEKIKEIEDFPIPEPQEKIGHSKTVRTSYGGFVKRRKKRK